MSVIAETVAAIGVIINVISYFQNDINRFRLISAIALAFLSVHFYLIDAMAAAVVLGLSCVRNLLAMRWQNMLMVMFFVTVSIAFFLYEWFWLNNGWHILIVYLSSLIFIVGVILIQDTQVIRRWFILAEFMGLCYAVIVGSIFGGVFNFANIVSILVKQFQERRLKIAG